MAVEGNVIALRYQHPARLTLATIHPGGLDRHLYL